MAAEVNGQPMAMWPWHQCRARTEVKPNQDWGRCDLRAGHDGPHALERGMYDAFWTTAWTDSQGQPLPSVSLS